MDQAEAMEYDPVQILLIKGHIFLTAEKLDEAKEAFGKAIRMSDSRKQTLLRVIVSFYDNRALSCHSMIIAMWKAHMHSYKDS